MTTLGKKRVRRFYCGLSLLILMWLCGCSSREESVLRQDRSGRSKEEAAVAGVQSRDRDTSVTQLNDETEKGGTHFEECEEDKATTVLVVKVDYRGLMSNKWTFPLRLVDSREPAFLSGGIGTGSGHGETEDGHAFSAGGSVHVDDTPNPGVDLALYLYWHVGKVRDGVVEQRLNIPVNTKSEMQLHQDLTIRCEFIRPDELWKTRPLSTVFCSSRSDAESLPPEAFPWDRFPSISARNISWNDIAALQNTIMHSDAAIWEIIREYKTVDRPSQSAVGIFELPLDFSVALSDVTESGRSDVATRWSEAELTGPTNRTPIELETVLVELVELARQARRNDMRLFVWAKN